jgi:DNA polymerase III delta prime subunit
MKYQLEYCEREMTALDGIFHNFDNSPEYSAARFPSANTARCPSTVTETGVSNPVFCSIPNRHIEEKYKTMMTTSYTDSSSSTDATMDRNQWHHIPEHVNQKEKKFFRRSKPGDHEQRRIVEIFDKYLRSPQDGKHFAYLLTGPPGTGKSNVVYLLQDYTETNPFVGPLITLACFGIAAINVGGTTISSVIRFLLPSDNDKIADIKLLNPENLAKFCDDLCIAPKDTVHHVSLLVIDEILTVSPVLLAVLSERLKQATGKPEPFGGIPVLLVGDFSQLPPVTNISLAHGMMDLKIHQVWHDSEVARLLSVHRTTAAQRPPAASAPASPRHSPIAATTTTSVPEDNDSTSRNSPHTEHHLPTGDDAAADATISSTVSNETPNLAQRAQCTPSFPMTG